MVVLDIETSGLNPSKNHLLSIGAVDFDTGEEFYVECRVNPNEISNIDPVALKVNGFTIDELVGEKSKDKPTQEEGYIQFYNWAKNRDNLIAGQQVGSFDLAWLKVIHENLNKSGTFTEKWPFKHRAVDLHSICYYLFKESLSLDGILLKLGLEPEPKPHVAINGARLERDAFKRIFSAPGWKS